MKKVVCIVLVLLICTSMAFAESALNHAPTTEHVIQFSGFPMGISYLAFEKKLIEMGAKFKTRHADYGDSTYAYSTSSSSFGDGVIIPRCYSQCVETRVYHIEHENTLSDLLKVAGHGVNWVEASFFTGYSQSKGGLYEIRLYISDDYLISPDEQYADLAGKLSKLYGQPYTADEEYSGWYGSSNTRRISVWIGSNDTAVYLENIDFVSGGESVYLVYGLYSSMELFAEKEAEYEAQLEKKKTDALDSIADDYSGL